MNPAATLDSTRTPSGLPRRLPLASVCIPLLVLRAAALLTGLDRLPMLPSVNPEVIINDPALALSSGHGFVAFSFEHSVNGLNRLYGHFPPLYIALQAVIFRLFGFSAIAMRASSVVFDLATCCAFLAVLGEFYRQK